MSILPVQQLRSDCRRGRPRPALEALEGRLVPSTLPGVGPPVSEPIIFPGTFVWINPSGGAWNDASNWSGGQVPAAADAAIIPFSNVVVTFSAAGTQEVKSLTCAGTLKIASGTLEILDTSSVRNLELDNGTLASEDTLRVTGDFHWLGGTLAGVAGHPSTVELLGNTMAVGGGSVKALKQVLVSNFGVFDWEQGDIRSLSLLTGRFSNKPGGTFLAHADSAAFKPIAENLGSWVIDNAGSVQFNAFTNAGDLTLDGGRMKVSLFTQTAGVTRLDGGSLSSSADLTFGGGQLVGGGTITGSVVNSGATITPTPAGTTGHKLTIDGDYTQGAGGVLQLLLSGAASAGKSDQLIVKGTATLGGTLQVRANNLPDASGGDAYKVVKAGSLKGTFASVTTPAATGGTIAVSYTSTQAILTLTPAKPKPAPAPVPITPKDPTLINGGNVVASTLAASTLAASHHASATTPADTSDDSTFSSAATSLSSGQARSMLGNSGLLGAVLNGAGGGNPTSSAGDAANSFSGRLAAASLALAAGEKSSSGRGTDDNGLADEALATFRLQLPELELPSDGDLLSVAELNRDLLVGGAARADIVPQAGSQLSVVATLVAGEDGRGSGEEQGESPLADLFISPLALPGVGRPAPRRLAAATQEDAGAEEAADEIGGARAPRAAASGALIVLTAFAGVIVGMTRSERAAQRKLCSGPGKRPSRTSRQ
jgi:hypothetical protein